MIQLNGLLTETWTLSAALSWTGPGLVEPNVQTDSDSKHLDTLSLMLLYIKTKKTKTPTQTI